jgi:hypothetical protein
MTYSTIFDHIDFEQDAIHAGFNRRKYPTDYEPFRNPDSFKELCDSKKGIKPFAFLINRLQLPDHPAYIMELSNSEVTSIEDEVLPRRINLVFKQFGERLVRIKEPANIPLKRRVYFTADLPVLDNALMLTAQKARRPTAVFSAWLKPQAVNKDHEDGVTPERFAVLMVNSILKAMYFWDEEVLDGVLSGKPSYAAERDILYDIWVEKRYKHRLEGYRNDDFDRFLNDNLRNLFHQHDRYMRNNYLFDALDRFYKLHEEPFLERQRQIEQLVRTF